MTLRRHLATALILAACAMAPPAKMLEASEPISDAASPWRLVFEDEFDGTGKPDPTKWISEAYERRKNPDGPDGWWSPANVALDGEGHLVLTTSVIPNRGADGDPYDFATGMVSTKGLFEQAYGRYEARAMMPRERGWWAAFWLFGEGVTNEAGQGDDGTEIDIIEGFGRTDRVQHALHWNGYGEAHQIVEKKFVAPGISDGFHTYAVEWTPAEYVFFVDGEETWRTDAGGVSDVPVWVKLTAELSTEAWAVADDWAGALDPAAYPDAFVVDYVRVWALSETKMGADR